MEHSNGKRNVAILIYNQVEVLDFAGPFQVFITASNRGQDFHVYAVAEHNEPITALGGLCVWPAYAIHQCPQPDVLIVPGGWGLREEMNNRTLTNWIHSVSDRAELILSVCTGALILAKSNLLDGLMLTTNQRAFHELREVAPSSAKLIENRRYVDNGKIILSAGVSAGMDASLYAVGRLLGAERADMAAALMEYDWKKNLEDE